LGRETFDMPTAILPTVNKVILHLLRVKRRYGRLALVQKLAHWLLKRAVGIQVVKMFWISRESFCLTSSVTSEISYRPLSAAEVRAFAADPSNDLTADLADRIVGGRNFCFAALASGRLAAYSWCALEAIEAEHALGVALSYPKHVAYLYKGFTPPEFRAKSLRRGILELVFQDMGKRSVRELFALVDATNFSVVRGCPRFGYTLLGHMVLSRLGRCRVLFFPQRAKQLGILFGKESVAHS
jgi:hypothetical protein